MTDPAAENEDAREAAAMGEKPDLGHVEDALKKALQGSDSGSDTRAGSLRGVAQSVLRISMIAAISASSGSLGSRSRAAFRRAAASARMVGRSSGRACQRASASA